MALGLAACSSGSNDADNDTTPPDDTAPIETTTVQGQVVNGPLAGAEVLIYNAEGELLGTATTDENGDYVLDVPANPPYRIVTQGGELDGQPYQGSMQAWCETASPCTATPYTTALLAVMEAMSLSMEAAINHLTGLLGVDLDPFTHPGISTEFFLPDAAREAINYGAGLQAWVNSVVAWAQDQSQPAPAGVPVPEPETPPPPPPPPQPDPTPAPPPPPPSYIVSTSAGSGGSISPTSRTVSQGNATSFTVSPTTGYSIDTVGGTCGGTLDGNTYTTGAITADCTVTASFSLNSYTVTPTAGANGSIDPATAQTVNHGAITSFTLAPNTGYSIDAVSGTCGGTLDGNTYSTDAITANCTVVASFIALGPQDLAVTAGHQVNLAWAPVTGATDYCVYVSDSTGINLATAASYDMGLSACTGNTDTRYTTTSLSHGTRYYFVVTAKIGADESGVSTEVSAMPVSRPMNDTGIDWCAQGITNNLTCPQEGFVGQDGDHGRDADNSLVKAGGGSAGFDFTKLDASGNPLVDQGAEYAITPWACVQDNHTGLMWEVKVDDDTSMHHMYHAFSWHNSDPSTNGGHAGTASGGTCAGTVAAGCDTEKFVAAVNDLGAPGLCGHRDWRMPDSRELLSIVHNGRVSPAIDTGWFPNTPGSWFWSSSPSAGSTGSAWDVGFNNGFVDLYGKFNSLQVRLVRAGQ